MFIRVLIVDDSRFICNRIQEVLQQESDFLVVGIASNGQQAIKMAKELKPDVITMDVEMPVMDGISAVKKIMAECPTGILMFSATTKSGAKATLDALDAGAVDFLPKQLDDIAESKDMAKRLLRRRVRMVAKQAKTVRLKANSQINPLPLFSSLKQSISLVIDQRNVDLLVIVASTGGPVAIQKILPQLPSSCLFPTLIVQHMPQNFTHSFAQRLNQQCAVTVKEAVEGDVLKAGEVLLAPGGLQMEVNICAEKKVIAIREKQKNEIYSPSADITLSSIANLAYNNVLTVVLTGMGADGKEGAIKCKQKGFSVWAQDEESCTIYGMPKVIVENGLADNVFNLDEIATQFKRLN